MGPEVYESESDPSKTYTEKCDIYSLGVLLYQMYIRLINKIGLLGSNYLLDRQLNR